MRNPIIKHKRLPTDKWAKAATMLKIGAVEVVIALPFLSNLAHTYIQSFNEFYLNHSALVLHSIFAWSPDILGSNEADQVWRFFPFSIFFYIFNYLFKLPSNVTIFMLLFLLFSLGFWAFYILIRELFRRDDLPDYVVYIGGL